MAEYTAIATKDPLIRNPASEYFQEVRRTKPMELKMKAVGAEASVVSPAGTLMALFHPGWKTTISPMIVQGTSDT